METETPFAAPVDFGTAAEKGTAKAKGKKHNAKIKEVTAIVILEDFPCAPNEICKIEAEKNAKGITLKEKEGTETAAVIKNEGLN